MYSTNPFPASAGIEVGFDYADYGGSGADGLTLFLFGQNSNTTGTPLSLTTGPTGGSLGYADCPSSHENGLTNAYLGVGLDEWGNFGLTNFCGVPTGAGTAGLSPSGRYPSYAIVRGPGSAQTGYAYATGAPIADPGNAAETLRGTGIADYRHVTVSVTSSGLLSIYVTFPDGNTETVTRNYQISAAPPPYLQLGFTASTGGSTDYHDIRNAQVTDPVDVQTRVSSATVNATRGSAISDTFTVQNAGPNETVATQVGATTAASLSGVSWTCTGACHQTAGSGLPSDTVDLPVNATATYTITATDSSNSDATAAIRLTATPTGATGQSVPGDNVATASTLLPPIALTAPAFTLADGSGHYGGVATLTPGTYFGSAVNVTEQWQHCLADGTGCVDISGATGATYTTTSADRGWTLRVGEIASNAAGSTPAAYTAAFSPLPATTMSTATPVDGPQTSATFTLGTSNYAASAVGYECDLDGAGWSPCSPTPTFSGLSDGAHSLQARSVFAGLSDPSPQSFSWTVDTVAPAAPVIVAPSAGSEVNRDKPPISGTAEPNSTVKVYLDGALSGTATAGGSGAWTYAPPSALAEGPHTVRATATDGAGNVSPFSVANGFTVDTIAPPAPVISAPADGAIGNDAKPPISGTAEPGSTVTVSIDGAVVGTAAVSAAGAWSFSGTPVLGDGAHHVTATATDAADNVSPDSAARGFTVDTVAPAPPVIAAPADGSATNNVRPPISGTAEPGSTVVVYIDGGAAGITTTNGSGGWSYAPTTALADGAHTVAATATDAASNVSARSGAAGFTVDTTAPAPPVITAPADAALTNDSTPTVHGTAEAHDTITVSVDGSSVGTTTADAAGAWSLAPTAALGDGHHTLTATATDPAGNTGAPSLPSGFTIDTTPPAAPVVGSPADGSSTNDVRPPISGTAEANSTVAVYVDGTPVGTATAGASGAWSLAETAALGDGTHAVEATATDAAGNTGAYSGANTFTVDTVAPAAPVISAPAAASYTNDKEPAITGTAEPGSTVRVFVDGSPVGFTTTDGEGNWSYAPTAAIADGRHTVTATATDAAGNASGASYGNGFTVETVPPAPAVVKAATGGSDTSNREPPITGTAAPDSTVTVYVDGAPAGTTTTNGSGAWSYVPTTPLSDGPHTVKVTVTDAADNVSAPSNDLIVTVDTSPPPPPVVNAPADGSYTNNNEPPISGTAQANTTVTVYIDGFPAGNTPVDGLGNWSYTPTMAIPDGPHGVEATATDAAHNVSLYSSTNNFTVDTAAPAPPTITAPGNGSTVNNSQPPVQGTTEPNATVTVYIDGSPAGTTTANGSGAWSLTPSTPLSDGLHRAKATAEDEAGNLSGASPNDFFTINTVAPPVPDVSLPADASATNSSEPPVSGTAEANDTVTVYIDGSSVGTTTADGSGNWSYTPTTPLPDGPHSVKVTATNAANNTSGYSNTNTFTVDTVAPAAPVVNAPADGSSTNVVQPPVSGTAEANSTVKVYIDGSPAGTATADGSGAWSYAPTSALTEGQHTVRATATDAAQNTSVASSTNTFTIDTTAPAAPLLTAPVNGSVTDDATPPITGTAEPGSTVTVWIDGSSVGTTPVDGTGAWSYTPTASLANGPHAVKATATDAASNISFYSATNDFTVQTVAPAAPTITAPVSGSTSGDARPTISGTATADSVITVYLDGQGIGSTTADSSGGWSLPVPFALAAGSHTVTATAADGAGNVSPQSTPDTFNVDGGAPPPPTIVSQPSPVSKTSAFTFAPASGATLQCSIDGQPWQQCPSSYDPSPLSDGPHTLAVRQVDASGTPSASETVAWVLDTTAPGPPTVTGGPLGSTPVNHGTFTWTPATPGGTFQCQLDGAPWTLCVQGVTYTGLALGAHTFAVREIDPAGNVGAISRQLFSVGSKDPLAPTRAGVDASRRVVVSADLPVGCHLDHGALQSCTVVAWGRVHDRWRYFGAGQVRLSSPQGARAPVTIALDPLARSMLQRTYAGVPTVLSAKATAFGLGGRALPAAGFTRIVLPARLLVPDTGLFAFDSAAVESTGRGYIDYLGTSLSGVRSLTCIGFTDSVGSEAYNYELGLRRASAVCGLLSREPSLGGVPYKVTSFGKLRPRATNATSSGRALNRFVQVLVTYRSIPYQP